MTVVLISANLMGCSTSGNASARVLPRAVPGAPSYLVPVHVANPVLGEDPFAIAARERAGRLQANRIIVRGSAEWNTMAAEFAQ
jgi:hypothetical protein